MKFIVSKRYVTWMGILEMGEQYFKSLPVWAQNAPAGKVTIIFAPSSQLGEDVRRALKHRIEGKASCEVLTGNIPLAYLEFFTRYVRRVIRFDPTLNAVFLQHLRKITEPEFSSRDIEEQLFRQLTWYFLESNSLREYNPERFEFCQELANQLMFTGLPQGTLQ